jgi:release factor glutamine methyltransferase
MLEGPTIRQLLDWSEAELISVSETPRLDSEVLLSHCLQKDRSYLFTWPDKQVSADQRACFEQLIHKRMAPQPIAYLLGQREFYSLELKTTPATLVPRPETELLVDTALDLIAGTQQPRILDLGTGTGAIPLAIKQQRPDAELVATDVSLEALDVARTNSADLKLEVEFRQSDWFGEFEKRRDAPFDVIVSNPPYIAEQDPYLFQGDLPAEPRLALTSGPSGLDALTTIIADAVGFLKAGGWLVLEHGYDQGKSVRALMQKEFSAAQTLQDFNGLDRVTFGQFPG